MILSETSMNDLVTFMRDRINEDEQVARATLWDNSGNSAEWKELFSATLEIGTETIVTSDRTVNQHMARWDPARVLAEVEAKRQIIDLYAGQAAKASESALHEDRTWTLKPVLAALATPYADHPDYNPTWATDGTVS